MSNPGMRLTRAGKNILAQGLLGEEIHFTKVAFGDADFDYASENLLNLTALKSWKLDLPIVKKTFDGDGTVTITALCTNFELEKGFRAKEIGVFATDQSTGNEVLYAYRNAGDEYNFIPAKTGVVTKNSLYAYKVEVGDAENVTFNLDFSFTYVSQEEFIKHTESSNPHPNIPSYAGTIPPEESETAEFWAADPDNNLRKISVEVLRKILLANIENKVTQNGCLAEENRRILDARADISFDANLIVVEDFKPPSMTDALKIKVTSCAANANSIGVESCEGLKTGATYWLSDGINLERVKVVSVSNSASGLHVKTAENLNFNYDQLATWLYSSTFSAAKKKSFTWKSPTAFIGHVANVQRTKILDTSLDNAAAFDISGDGFLSADGFFSMWR